jgi:DNA-binding SARP family transcriptional activator
MFFCFFSHGRDTTAAAAATNLFSEYLFANTACACYTTVLHCCMLSAYAQKGRGDDRVRVYAQKGRGDDRVRVGFC